MTMRNFIKAGLVLLIAGVVMTSACSSDKPSAIKSAPMAEALWHRQRYGRGDWRWRD